MDNTTKHVFCHCDTELCDAPVDGPKYDAGLLTPSLHFEDENENGRAGEGSGSTRAQDMTWFGTIVLMLWKSAMGVLYQKNIESVVSMCS